MQHLDNTNSWLSRYFYCYTVGPLIGGAVAGLFYLMHEKCHKEPEIELAQDHSLRLNNADLVSQDGKQISYKAVTVDQMDDSPV